jgi:hypothetical protein
MDLPIWLDETWRWLPLLAGFQVRIQKPLNPDAVQGRQWLEKAEEAYGADSPRVVPFLLELSERIINGPGDGVYLTALQVTDRALEIQSWQAAPESVELAQALVKAGECAAFTRDAERADACLQQALAIRRARLGDDHPLTGQAWTMLAMAQIIAAQPAVQPEMLVMQLSLQAPPVQQLPPPSQEAAAKALHAFDLLQRSKYDGPGYRPPAGFDYKPMRVAFRVYEQMNDDLSAQLTALRRGPAGPAAPGGGNQGCFVATAVYGGADCPEVAALRRFRDERLLPHAAGRLAVRIYYRVGPTLARWVAVRPRLAGLCRRVLDRLARRQRLN